MVKSIMNPPKELQNTDKVLWDSKDGMESVFVTERESIGINVAGNVTVMPARAWLDEINEVTRLRCALGEARARISKLEKYIIDKLLNDEL
mgnify:CR=1 FL=1